MTTGKDLIPRNKFQGWWLWHIKNPIWVFWHSNLLTKLHGYKPLKWGLYFPILSVKFWANRFQEFHLGHMVVNKVTFVITIVNFIILISLKWDFDPLKYIIPISLITIFLVWMIGRFLEKKGFRKHFRDAEFKDVRLK